ncbi:AP-3 complex subunit delta [Diabrotica virgifera virgifera]|uniref:AP-3 complex subunit delta n=1 Tax=Diabrotica virgifera virgifera TaxID=50390 RepID=A0A6P7G8U8_DIAVI|nr:AP-3 complex subunit delta [Diabrotica virgifera virgifera]XP_050503148.1 AP-3 complex subunit delta [Diabrotica virgifera virgifera]
MALKKVKGNLERMFDKNLTDLVRGIRNNKENEAKYISECMEDIKQELRQDNLSVKSNAIAKLTYLQMLGYDISWAGFNIIEVMSSSKFTLKRIGYLAASQSFHCDSELLMLTTNMIRKELNSQNQYEAGLALTSLSCYISTDLARDLSNDILTLLSSTKPYIRKKAVLMMYKVFLKYPDALRPAFPRLKEKLEDPDPGVQSAAVNVVCELARKNPKNYLSLAPVFFKLMTTSTNNWMLIKIIKLFGALTPLEPRLGKKLIEPLTNLIHSTSAMSLLYECINTVIAVLISISSGMPNHAASIQLCVQKLRILIEDSDQNLKYLGLLAMSKILKTHPKSVQSHKDLILQCLEDKDESIRLRALDLLYGMVSKKNLMEIVKKLMVHMDKAEGTVYRDELLSKIILICSQNNYQFITNFEWYVTVLVELAQMEFGSKQGHVIGAQLMDVCIRVQAIRAFTVAEMAQILDVYTSTSQFTIMQEVLYAAAWLCGEFVSELKDPEQTLKAMVKYKILPQHIESVFIQNILKVFTFVIRKYETEEQYDEIQRVCDLVIDKLSDSIKSAELEVQERASTSLMIIKIVREECESRKATGNSKLMDNEDVEGKTENTLLIADELESLFSGELNPVAPKAQRKVPVPDGLDLDAWINEPVDESESDSEPEMVENLFVKSERTRPSYQPEPTEEEMKKSREARKYEQQNNPHYLKSNDSIERNGNSNGNEHFESIPIAELNLNVPLKMIGQKRSDKYLKVSKTSKKKKTSRKKKHKSESSSDEEVNHGPVIEVKRDMELPEGATISENESDHSHKDDPHRALDIDLNLPTYDSSAKPEHPKKQLKEKKEKKHSKKKLDKEKSSKDNNEKRTKENCNSVKVVKEKSSKKKNGRHKEKTEHVAKEANLLGLDDVAVEAVGGETDVKEIKKEKKKKKSKTPKETAKEKEEKEELRKSYSDFNAQ